MKIQISKIVLLFVMMFFSGIQLQAEVKNKPMTGEWAYEVSDAPYGYQKGTLVFSEKEGKTVCVVKLEAGELTVSDLKIEKDKVSFATMVDGNSIKVEMIRKKDKLTGTVESPEGPKAINAVKK